MKDGAKATQSIRRTASYIPFLLMIVLFLTAIVVGTFLTDFGSSIQASNYFLVSISMSLSILLYSFCFFGFTWDAREKRLFEVTVYTYFLFGLLTLAQNICECRPALWQHTMRIYTASYLLSPLYWVEFWLFQKRKVRYRLPQKTCVAVCFIFIGIYWLVALVNHFTGFCFSVDPDGRFVLRSYLIYLLTILWFVLYFILTITAQCDRKTKGSLLCYSLFPLLGWALCLFFYDSEFYIRIFSNLALLLHIIPLHLLFYNVYLENGQLSLRRERELELSRSNAIMLKISPHFIANTMGSIVALCGYDAQKAGELASQFAVYLRDNYADMSEEAMIPFSTELEHIRNYLAIEEVRFPGLKVEYDIQSEAFLLPTLTVQPLVENAVRHGISKRRDASGTVEIASLEEKDCYLIRITDDGVGFDSAEHKDEKHIGISNAKARLMLLCAGTLTVTSRRGQGTVCEIRIPKGENEA